MGDGACFINKKKTHTHTQTHHTHILIHHTPHTHTYIHTYTHTYIVKIHSCCCNTVTPLAA